MTEVTRTRPRTRTGTARYGSPVVATDELFGPAFFIDPYPIYAALRAREPVQETAFGPWLLLRYDDVNRVLAGPGGQRPERRLAALDDTHRAGARPASSRPARPMLHADPPDHTRLRRLVQKAFTPRVIADLRPLIEELVDTALDEFDPTRNRRRHRATSRSRCRSS